MRLKGKITVDDRWGRYRQELGREVAASLLEAAGAGAAAARAKPSRYNIADIENPRHDVPLRLPGGGWVIDIRWDDFRARWFDKGTYQKLGRVASVRSKPGAAGSRGVRPARFMARARSVGRTALILALSRRLR